MSIEPHSTPRGTNPAYGEIYAGLARFFFPSGVGPMDAPRIGRITKNLIAKGANFEELILRIARWDMSFPNCAGNLTIDALNKHWDRLGMPPKPKAPPCPPKPALYPGVPMENQTRIAQQQHKDWTAWQAKYNPPPQA